MKKFNFNDYNVMCMSGLKRINSFHLEWLDEEFAEKNKNEYISDKNKMIPLMTWCDKRTLDISLTLWLDREGLYYFTFEQFKSNNDPKTWDYGIGFKTANEAIENYFIM